MANASSMKGAGGEFCVGVVVNCAPRDGVWTGVKYSVMDVLLSSGSYEVF